MNEFAVLLLLQFMIVLLTIHCDYISTFKASKKFILHYEKPLKSYFESDVSVCYLKEALNGEKSCFLKKIIFY